MLIRLFWLFLKINLLTVSGPASLGLTKQLVVPGLMPETDFVEMAAVASGVPGSDAVQMALQVGYKLDGVVGAIVAILGALLPCILLVSVIMAGMKFIPTKILNAFFKGVTPALAVLLVITALQLVQGGVNWLIVGTAILALALFLLHVPVAVVLVACGVAGILAGGLK
jgi:chromate transporter